MLKINLVTIFSTRFVVVAILSDPCRLPQVEGRRLYWLTMELSMPLDGVPMIALVCEAQLIRTKCSALIHLLDL